MWIARKVIELRKASLLPKLFDEDRLGDGRNATLFEHLSSLKEQLSLSHQKQTRFPTRGKALYPGPFAISGGVFLNYFDRARDLSQMSFDHTDLRSSPLFVRRETIGNNQEIFYSS